MKKLVSEQLPNDGGWHIDRLAREANERLNQIGKRGKRAKIVVKKNSLSLQFSFKDGHGNPQKNVGIGSIVLSAKGVEEAEGIAQLVTGQLVAGTFTWDWFNSLIGKDTSENTKVLTCKEMVEIYKKHYFKQRKNNKSVTKSWYSSCAYLEKTIGSSDKTLSLSLIRQIIDCTENDTPTRTYVLNGIVGFLKHFDINDYKSVIKEYKENNNPKPKARNIPSDQKIAEIQKSGFEPSVGCNKNHLYRYPQWQFLYGLLATYGLRIHEAWSIANWDKSVILKDGDWVVVDTGDDESIELQRDGADMVIPAILDPDNKDYILCIKHETKTGYRMTMPISPEGHNWLEEFNLLQPLNLPDIKNPLKRRGVAETIFKCTPLVGGWFRRQKYGFTPHDLRHAYAIRGHVLDYNPKALADSAGHSMQMSANTYTKHMKLDTKYENLISASNKRKGKDSMIELLKSEIEALKNENENLKNENELLRIKLKMEKTLAKE